MSNKLIAVVRWLLLAGLLCLAYLSLNSSIFHAWQTAAPPGYENPGPHARMATFHIGYSIAFCFVAALLFLNVRAGWPYIRSKYSAALVAGLAIALIGPRLGYYVVENQCRSDGGSWNSKTESCSVAEVAQRDACDDPACGAIDTASLVFRPAPYFVNGDLVGYRLYPGSNEKSFNALGLELGVLVVEIDGQGLQDPAEARELFLRVSSGKKVPVRIERDGRSEVIDVQAK